MVGQSQYWVLGVTGLVGICVMLSAWPSPAVNTELYTAAVAKPIAAQAPTVPFKGVTSGSSHDALPGAIRGGPAQAGTAMDSIVAEPPADQGLITGLLATLMAPISAITAGLVLYGLANRQTRSLSPVEVHLISEETPIAMMATAGARALPQKCIWDPVGVIRNVVTFEREVEAQLLHGRYCLWAALVASPGMARTAAHHVPTSEGGWDYIQGLVYGAIFGLGAPEIAVIVITAGLVLGPKKLAELARDAGKVTGQLKDVTSEFQDAVSEGMREARDARVEPKPAPQAPKAEPAEPPQPPPPSA